jgi:hypothetical protein
LYVRLELEAEHRVSIFDIASSGIQGHAAPGSFGLTPPFARDCGGPDEDAIRRAHDKMNFPYDSITEVRRMTGVDLRPSAEPAKK